MYTRVYGTEHCMYYSPVIDAGLLCLPNTHQSVSMRRRVPQWSRGAIQDYLVLIGRQRNSP